MPSVSSSKPSISKITALIGPNSSKGAFIASDPFSHAIPKAAQAPPVRDGLKGSAA
jgi:hypothetical protein